MGLHRIKAQPKETGPHCFDAMSANRSSEPREEAHLKEGHQQLEVLIRAAKAVYNRDVAEVEWVRITLDAECIEAVAAREEAAKATKEL
ncbi:hypothetical protein E2562_009288 [Oryza meyeriana var. granulata]|uniref:Uncharacterized protein n=1 Tax=Oryza meyeriana var. granulata TaxID=110450 RepID=A0A6G1E9Y4_9ORYZ|nr:hypothetical protein E2562_009288 [Oryza meyeriana var. granulata]